MEELIRISDNNGKQAVSARELHEFLESKREFATWIKDRIKKYGLVENQDYVCLTNLSSGYNEQVAKGGYNKIEYALTLDCAKELAMVEGNAKGKTARQYFIQKEKELRQLQKPISPAEQLLANAQLLVEQEKRLSSVETKVLEIEAKTTTRPDYFTIVGYGTLNKISVNLRQASLLGRRASDICKRKGYETDKIADPRFGYVKMYPRKVLEEVFSAPMN